MATSLLRYSTTRSLTILSAQTASTALDGREYAIFGLALPAAFTGVALTFTVCATAGGTFQALYDATGATLISMAVAQGRSYDLPAELASWPFWRIVSGSAEGADRTLTVVVKG